jgi:hypothetical protein
MRTMTLVVRTLLLAYCVAALAACGGAAGAPDAALEVVNEAGSDTVDDAADATAGQPDAGEAEAEGPVAWWEGLAPAGDPLYSRLGVSSHLYLGPEPNVDTDFELARLGGLGAFRVRTDFLWELLEPAQGQLAFEAVETGVDRILAAGGRITAILDYGVGWAMPDGTPGSIEPDVYGAFAGAVADRFCGRIDEFEVWNEPNLDAFWKPAPDPARYALLLEAAHDAVKAACPGARVLLGGQSSADADLDNGWWFLKELGAAFPGVCSAFDALAVHPYTNNQAWPPERDLRSGAGYIFPGQSAMTGFARQRLADWGCPERPVVFTEVGWPSYEVSEADQGRWLARSLLLAVRDGVADWDWYTFWDGEPITTGPRPHENYFGLFGWSAGPVEPRREKPAWRALQGLADTLGRARFAGDLSTALDLPDDVFALAFQRPDDALVLALWDGRDQPDAGPQGFAEGGPDTTRPLSLAIPPFAATVEVLDLEGQATSPAAPVTGGPLDLVLTPAVQYVVFRGAPPAPPTVTLKEDLGAKPPCEDQAMCVEDYQRFIELAQQYARPVSEADILQSLQDIDAGLVPMQAGPMEPEALRTAILEGLNIAFLADGLDERPLTVTTIGVTQSADVVETRLLFQDPWVGTFEALLLTPSGPGPFPTVLALHGHGDDPLIYRDEYHGGEYPGRGLALLVPGLRAMGSGPPAIIENTVTKKLLVQGFTLMGLRVYEALLAYRYLRARPDLAEPGRIGLIGHSGGSSAGNLVARVEPRLAAYVSDYQIDYAEWLAPYPFYHCETVPALYPLNGLINDFSTCPAPVLTVPYKYTDSMERIFEFFGCRLGGDCLED